MTRWTVPGLVHVRELGEDHVGRRVVARQRRSRRVVSVTYLSEEFRVDAEFRDRFGRDYERLAQVRNTSVARVRQYVEHPDGAAVVADHVEGASLRAVLVDEGVLTTEAAFVVFRDVLRGLAVGHEAGLAHGDVKPEDVVLTRAGRVRLVDFGLSTRDGRRLLARSTPFYLAPEQWNGGPASQPADLYAATVTFFECLTGGPPFHADNPGALFALHEHAMPPFDVVSASVHHVLRCGLAKDPLSRPSTRGFLSQVEQAAASGLNAGWERRGRRQLSRLVTGAPQPPALVQRPRDSAAPQWHLRLATVVGGALVLAAGLTSPPVPSGPSSATGGEEGPPVRTLPGPAGDAAEWAQADQAVTDITRSTQSAAVAEPVGPVTAGAATPGETAAAGTESSAHPGSADVDPARPPVQQSEPPLAPSITPTPRTAPPPQPPQQEPCEPEAEQEPAPPSEPESSTPSTPESTAPSEPVPHPEKPCEPEAEQESTAPSGRTSPPQQPSDGAAATAPTQSGATTAPSQRLREALREGYFTGAQDSTAHQ